MDSQSYIYNSDKNACIKILITININNNLTAENSCCIRINYITLKYLLIN